MVCEYGERLFSQSGIELSLQAEVPPRQAHVSAYHNIGSQGQMNMLASLSQSPINWV